MLNRMGFRFSLPLVLFALSGSVSAVGLGELRGQPSLGDRLRLEIELLGTDKQPVDPACFRLVRPAGSDDLPWLKQASLSVRKGTPQVLQIRSEIPLREPILQVAIQLACGHEISREYMLLASPAREGGVPAEPRAGVEVPTVPASRSVQRPPRVRPAQTDVVEPPPRLMPRKAERRPAPNRSPDRLMLSGGGEVGEPSLRLATELMSWRDGEAREAKRDILRLEYRMLMALNEQATTQMATAEKLRNMEDTLGELQQRAADFAGRVEKDAAAATPVAPKSEALPPPPVAPAVQPKVVKAAVPEESSGLSEWSIYGVLLGGLLGLGGWLGWRNYRERQQRQVDDEFPILAPEVAVDPQREIEHDEHVVDIHLGQPSSAPAYTAPIDLELDGGDAHATDTPVVSGKKDSLTRDSVLSMTATTVDEHFEANPVMELAEIMLSFGRVKGAAQALQEYIDNNPQEALQPWIRLMEVYRLAGMRNEFETVAQNLNQHFNVEVQHWDAAQASAQAAGLAVENATPVAPRPETIEDMPRLIKLVCDLWPTGDVVGYLYQLLRDNRGGKRTGFSLPVVEEILFLIELKETSNRIE